MTKGDTLRGKFGFSEGFEDAAAKEVLGRLLRKYESTPEPMPPVAPVTRYLIAILSIERDERPRENRGCHGIYMKLLKSSLSVNKPAMMNVYKSIVGLNPSGGPSNIGPEIARRARASDTYGTRLGTTPESPDFPAPQHPPTSHFLLASPTPVSNV
jgi:hypothetical protein